jgi:hypothetical protein
MLEKRHFLPKEQGAKVKVYRILVGLEGKLV